MGKDKSVQIKENNNLMFSPPTLSFLGATTCFSRFSFSSWCSDSIYPAAAAAAKSVPPTNSPTSSSPKTTLSPNHTMIFPPSFLDSSSCWNTIRNQLQQISSNSHITTIPSPAGPGDRGKNNTHPHSQDVVMVTAAGGGGRDDGGGARNSKPMSMPERARWARVPQPEPDLNCPRCDSTNTKFCYFNNYSLTQPRHYSRACRRYWTHGGALRTVPFGSGYRRRHTKRSAKPRATSADRAAVTRTSRTPNTTACTTGTTIVPSGLQYLPMFSSTPLFADCFFPESLDLNFPARLLLADAGSADDDGHHHHHHQGNWNGMEQWAAAQMNNFPFLEAMDHQMFEPPAAAMPTTMPTTMVAMHDMFHLGLLSGGNGKEDGGHHQFHHHAMLPAKGDHPQQQQDYPSSRGTYGDIVNAGGDYNFYSSANNAAGN